MARTFSDFSKLPKGLFRDGRETQAERPEPTARASDAGADALAYFGLTGAKPRANANRFSPPPELPAAEAAPLGDEIEARMAELRAELAKAQAEAVVANERAAAAEGELAEKARRLGESERERLRLAGECGCLRDVAERAETAPQPSAAPSAAPADSLLDFPRGFAEAFPGELRELALAALEEERVVAVQSNRERRAAALGALLAANAPSGELERRRAELRQTLKDAGSFNDAQTIAALDRLGFRLVSGKKHWKLDYAGVRMPLSKTPSDFRANLNTVSEMANRCF